MNGSHERRMDALLDGTTENTKSKAIDRAADFYIKMAGDNVAVPEGAFVELLATAERQAVSRPRRLPRYWIQRSYLSKPNCRGPSESRLI